MKKLLGLACVALLLGGCMHQWHEDYEKGRARWDTWSLAVITNHADENIESCVKTLKNVEQERAALNERINDTTLTLEVREDLKVQRGQVFQVGEKALAKLKAAEERLRSQIALCESSSSRTKLDPVADAHCFERIDQARKKHQYMTVRVKAIVDAWDAYTRGQPLGDLR